MSSDVVVAVVVVAPSAVAVAAESVSKVSVVMLMMLSVRLTSSCGDSKYISKEPGHCGCDIEFPAPQDHGSNPVSIKLLTEHYLQHKLWKRCPGNSYFYQRVKKEHFASGEVGSTSYPKKVPPISQVELGTSSSTLP